MHRRKVALVAAGVAFSVYLAGFIAVSGCPNKREELPTRSCAAERRQRVLLTRRCWVQDPAYSRCATVPVHDGLHHGGLEVPREAGRGRVDEHDPDHLFLRIDPEVRAVGAVPAEAANRSDPVRTRQVLNDIDSEAEAHASSPRVRREQLARVGAVAHQLHRPGTEQTFAVQRPAIEEHLRECR
jgi:hypothetical protein